MTHISADGAECIHSSAAERVPAALLCLDAFHVVAWATAALDEVRRALAAQLRPTGRAEQATTNQTHPLGAAEKPPGFTTTQRTTLAAIQADNGVLYRAYLLKEQLRMIFQAELPEARALLTGWIS